MTSSLAMPVIDILVCTDVDSRVDSAFWQAYTRRTAIDDEPQIAARYLTIKIAFYLVVLLFLIGNFAFPGYCLIAA